MGKNKVLKSNSKLKEFSNRKKADKMAEFITGIRLRRLLADKVHEYAGKGISVFDCAVGSGQSEQFIEAEKIVGVDVQFEALDAFKDNYPNAEAHCQSFFSYEGEPQDVAVANYPFSMFFKDLPDEEKDAINKKWPWKKSGNLDDIFILKSLDYTKRYGFFICFYSLSIGLQYQQLRDIIGYNLAEIIEVRNAFNDTNMPVILIIIDKEKASRELKRSIYDMRYDEPLKEEDTIELTSFDSWPLIYTDGPEDAEDIEEIKKMIKSDAIVALQNYLDFLAFLAGVIGEPVDFRGFYNSIYEMLDKSYQQLIDFANSETV